MDTLRWSLAALLNLACASLPCTVTSGTEPVIVVPTPVPDHRPSKFCTANAMQLAYCARAWERIVIKGVAPTGVEGTWNAAEFEGVVYGFFTGAGYVYLRTSHKPRWCHGILESYDQLYKIVADDLISHSARLTINDPIPEYLDAALKRLRPCHEEPKLP